MIVAIVITALWPHMYAKFDGFGFYVEGIGGYHVQWYYPELWHLIVLQLYNTWYLLKVLYNMYRH